MLDLAVGVIIGAAFGKVVSSLVEDIIMPPIGMLLSGVDFNKLSITLKSAVGDQPAVLIKYGIFINTLINFFIVAVCIFLMVKTINALREKEQIAPSVPTKEQILLTEIRDELRKP